MKSLDLEISWIILKVILGMITWFSPTSLSYNIRF